MTRDVRVLPDADAAARSAAEYFVEAALSSVKRRGRFVVALSGGQTPRPMYAHLADDASLREQMPWSRTHVFWSDERAVPPEHPDSNYRMVYETLLSAVPLPPENVYRIHADEPDLEESAERYEATLRTFFALREGDWPGFDLMLLGLGADGHTASLFPHSPVLHERRRLVRAVRPANPGPSRITLTFPVLNHSETILFLVTGTEKSEVLRTVLQRDTPSEDLPATFVAPDHGRVFWIVDRSAAERLADADSRL